MAPGPWSATHIPLAIGIGSSNIFDPFLAAAVFPQDQGWPQSRPADLPRRLTLYGVEEAPARPGRFLTSVNSKKWCLA